MREEEPKDGLAPVRVWPGHGGRLVDRLAPVVLDLHHELIS